MKIPTDFFTLERYEGSGFLITEENIDKAFDKIKALVNEIDSLKAKLGSEYSKGFHDGIELIIEQTKNQINPIIEDIKK